MSLIRGSLTAAVACICLIRPHSVANAQSPLLYSDLAIAEIVEDYGLNGDGVLVAVIDEGIDFQLADFRRADGTSRIESILDLTNPAGAADPDNPVDRGTVYTTAEIQSAIDAADDMGFEDHYGSATAIAGLIAGFADDDAGRPFQGLAPEATLVIVKTKSLGAPGDQTNSFRNPTVLYSAIDYVAQRAEALSMPAAVFIGGQTLGGPTDGTSRVSRTIDELSDRYFPRMIFVTATGDTNGISNHAAGTIDPGTEISIDIDKNQEQSLFFDLWYPTLDSNGQLLPPLEVTITDADGVTHGPYKPTNPEAFLSDRSETGVFSLFHRSDAYDLSQADNGKRQLLVLFQGKSGSYSVSLDLASEASEPVAFHATLSSNLRTGSNPSEFTSFMAGETVTDTASSESALVVNGYAVGAAWTDVNDQAQTDNPANGASDQLLTSANIGATLDGRDPVDFAAPAGSFFGPVPSDSYLASQSSMLIKNGLSRYGAVQENQVAAGLTTGLVALMLQLDPHLSADEAKAHLAATAVTDAATGDIPTPAWGAGKLDASAALSRTWLYRHQGEPTTFAAFAPDETGPRQIAIQTDPQLTYTLQYRESLNAGSWTNVGEAVTGNGELVTFTVPEENEAILQTGFFRVRIAPASE